MLGVTLLGRFGNARRLMITPIFPRTVWCGAILAGVLCLAGCSPDLEAARKGAGASLPRVALTGLTREPATSTDALRGKALVINFWATWCEPCRGEMQSLERLSNRFGPHGAQVIGITVDQDRNLAREFVRSQKLTFDNYADGELRALQESLGVRVLPETLLVTPDGVIAARVSGARDWNGAEGTRIVEQALKLNLAVDG